MSFRLRVKALKSGSSANIEIDDVIDSWGAASAKAIRGALKDTRDVPVLNVYINSSGGEVTEGLAIYNMLAMHGAQKVVEIGGIAASMASIIAMAGNKIIMPRNSWMMIHNPWSGICGESQDMRKQADLLDQFRDQLAGIYATRTGQELEAVLAAMAAETWMSGDEAKALGYCTDVAEPTKIAARFDARRFVNAPKALQRAKPKGQTMDLAELIALLGLSEDATAEDCVAAIKALQDKATESDDTEPTDGDDDTPPPDEKPEARARREAKAALKQRSGNAVLAAIRALGDKIDGVSKRVDGDERSRIIAKNIKKFNAKTEKQAQKWPLDVLKAFVRDADDLEDFEAPDDSGHRGAPKAEAEIKLTKEQLHLASISGQDPAKVLEHMKAQAAKKKVTG
jgi:ATP-dependent Clp endopeptidase proteolytic subunit ClpP